MSNTITYASGNFSTLPNQLTSDPKISLSAKGLYAFMRSKPPHWNFTIRSMAKQLKEGETALGNYLNELKDSGWIVYTKLSNGKGVYHLMWEVENKPEEDPNRGNPNLGLCSMAKPQRISKNDCLVKRIDSNGCNLQLPDADNAKPKNRNPSNLDGVEKAFEIYWQSGMVKQNKKKALSLFTAYVKKEKVCPHEFAEKLAGDVKARIAAEQMGFDRLHPTTYLANERWEDQLVASPSQAVSKPVFRGVVI